MLGQLHIKNVGIIEEITIDFDEGLNILTGETGAGKSLIIDSINAITGSRMSKDLIKTGADMAFIEACFFGEEDNTVLMREIYKNGRTICKINGKLATLAEMKEVGEALIDVHGQHENQSLLNIKTHIELLDNFIGEDVENLKIEYAKLITTYKELKSQIEKNYGDEKERARRIDLLKYQIEEIESSNLKNNEDEELENRRKLLMNSEKIVVSLNDVHDNVSDIVLTKLEECLKKINSISDIDEKYSKISNSLNDVYYTLQDIAADSASLIDEIDFSTDEQEQIEKRLDLICDLKRKYGNSIEDILNYYNDISKELNFLENSEEIINDLKNQLIKCEKELNEYASKISELRKNNAKILEEKINKELQDLEMLKSYVKFDFKKSNEYKENGFDEVQLLICTNIGEDLKPLSKIASGGEISRVMLAIKTVLCEYDSVNTMIFDEIDTGISGQAGKAVAEKMKIIGKTHQVICVTHLPVIAASGDSNYFIKKEVRDGRTYTNIKKLDENETIMEVARILSGNDITDMAIEHVKELRKKMK